MIPRRVWINLGVFSLLFLVLMNWAARSILSLDAVERPYEVTADFSNSPGLRNNVDVTYRGVSVGRVDSVKLTDGVIQVSMDIDRDVKLPRDLEASILRRTAVGEPYVSIKADSEYTGGGPYAEPGHHIAIDDTSVPVAYGDLFESLDALLDTLPQDDLALVVSELAQALDGRADDIRTIVQNSASVTGTLAERSELFDVLASELTAVTHNLTENRQLVSGSLHNVSELTQTLAANASTFEQLLATAPPFGEQVVTLLEDSSDELACAIDNLGGVFAGIGTEENIANLVAVLDGSGFALEALESALIEEGDGGADGPYLGGSFDLTNALEPGAAPPTYNPPPTLPDAGELATCPQERPATADGPGQAADVRTDASRGSTAENDTRSPRGDLEPSEAAAPTSSDARADKDQFPVEVLVAAAAIALIAVLLAATRPWRILGLGTGAGNDD